MTTLQARQFALRATGLVSPFESVASALTHHGYVQIDPINICGRMQDHMLRARVVNYRENALMEYLHGGATPLPPERRLAIEQHLPSSGNLVALETTAWPYLQAAMRERSRRSSAWSGRLSAREREVAKRLLAEVTAQGPLASDALVDERRARSVWGSASLVKATMQKLFFHGRLLIAQRLNNRRLYDLPERVVPLSIRERRPATFDEAARWEAQLKLRQRRLARLTRAELARVDDLVQPLEIEGIGRAYCLLTDVPLLHEASAPSPPPAPRLIAPLDPLIYDRTLTRALWDFDYTWEVYTPPPKRKRGYYALPVLSGHELVGDVDLRADRAAGRLAVVSRRLRRGHDVKPALSELASFLGLTTRRSSRSNGRPANGRV